MSEAQIQQLIDLVKQAISDGSALGTQLVVEYSARCEYLSNANMVLAIAAIVVFATTFCFGIYLKKKDILRDGAIAICVISIVTGLFMSMMFSIESFRNASRAKSPTYSMIKELTSRSPCGE